MRNRKQTMTWAEAKYSARRFIRYVSDPERQWTVNTAAGFLPSGWFLTTAEDGDLFPLTIANVSAVFRGNAIRAPFEG